MAAVSAPADAPAAADDATWPTLPPAADAAAAAAGGDGGGGDAAAAGGDAGDAAAATAAAPAAAEAPSYPLAVEYCPMCGLPPEYCRFNSNSVFAKCVVAVGAGRGVETFGPVGLGWGGGVCLCLLLLCLSSLGGRHRRLPPARSPFNFTCSGWRAGKSCRYLATWQAVDGRAPSSRGSAGQGRLPCTVLYFPTASVADRPAAG